ncbi:MAG: hypothetical protein EU533_07025 [Promethearchaeota archaeon]|nr:MAG: hypothetical protein EU533_07025 [Candidatus Lokiarchaeota archaeon]
MSNNIDLHTQIVLKLLNALDSEPIEGKIKFQKIAFMVLRNFPEIFEFFDFKPHKFGPYSEPLDCTLEEVNNKHEAHIEKETMEITDQGKEKLTELDSVMELSEKEKKNKEMIDKAIDSIKEEFRNFNSDEILAFIYKSDPDYISDSIVADKIDYGKVFLGLYEKGELGISKIAELLGWDLEKAYEFIKQNTKLHIL